MNFVIDTLESPPLKQLCFCSSGSLSTRTCPVRISRSGRGRTTQTTKSRAWSDTWGTTESVRRAFTSSFLLLIGQPQPHQTVSGTWNLFLPIQKFKKSKDFSPDIIIKETFLIHSNFRISSKSWILFVTHFRKWNFSSLYFMWLWQFWLTENENQKFKSVKTKILHKINKWYF